MANREQILFHDAQALPAADRAAFLATALAGEPAAQARLAALLRAADEAGGFLADDGDAAEIGESPGTCIGPYRLGERLGAGGFGSVYRAEQETPVRRTVALKIIKLGMDTRAVVARFAAERQALALMEHPHIARVLDGGATAAGRPYFVMELVPGVAVTTFCRERRLPLTARLELFLQVCRAVQHAHQKGVIHRDLKPSNILVTEQDGRPVAKVIDFGIAKAIDVPLTDGTLLSRLHLFVGTPAYMSPEQIGRGADVDTRADVYGLGALLYELLTDATPFDARVLAAGGYAATERVIREEMPPAPSRRIAMLPVAQLATVASARRVTPGRLRAALRGDLDRIVLQCLAKDRERRYDSANALARDLERHLRHEPVSARPASYAYLGLKFMQRHTRGVVATAAVTVAFASLGVYHTHRLTRERDRAQAEAEKARRVSELMTEVLSAADPFYAPLAGGAEPTVAGLLANSVARARNEFAQEPGLRADILSALGRVQLRRGDRPQAEKLLEEALAASRLAGAPAERLAQTLNDLGVLHREQGDFKPAVDALREAVQLRRARLAEDPNALAASLVELARTLTEMEQLGQAKPLFQEALAIRREALGEHRETAVSVGDLGLLLWRQGELAAAEPLLEEALAMNLRTLGPAHANLAGALANLALLRADQARLAEAEQLLRRAVDVAEHSLGPKHWRTASITGRLADVVALRGRLTEAAELFDRARATVHEDLGDEDPLSARLAVGRARVHLAAGEPARAEQLMREALRVQTRFCPAGGWQLATSWSLLGGALLAQGQVVEAEPLLTAAAHALKDMPGPQGRETAATRARLAELARRIPRT